MVINDQLKQQENILGADIHTVLLLNACNYRQHLVLVSDAGCRANMRDLGSTRQAKKLSPLT